VPRAAYDAVAYCLGSRVIATFKTVFPPLLIELQHHLLYLKGVVDRVLADGAAAEAGLPPAEYWHGYEPIRDSSNNSPVTICTNLGVAWAASTSNF
jgi:hypothetical protein